MSSMDPSSSKRKEAKGKSKAAFDKLKLKEPIELSEHEEIIMGEVIGPDDIAVHFSGACLSSLSHSWQFDCHAVPRKHRY
jgi:hypothetical protein